MVCCIPLSPTNVPNNKSEVAFKIPMNCIECERIMTDVISKFKGVDKYVTDLENEKILVTGSFNQEKLLKKLVLKVKKEVEIVKKEERNVEPEIVERAEESEIVEEEARTEVVAEPNSHEIKDIEKIMLFSDANPNAKCSIS
ncbi:unnamed protein product [Arabis nemorensis]|uniref:HMA domain-containing protein n=1 Tax=Arabis nemorensis TaxID=586526 RepID=A0A565BHF8_9BRAS|nr:unnamed protein product [Arabis nemorensis]